MTKLFSKAQQARAEAFLHEQGRALERALYDYYFKGGTATAVLDRLAAYQNPDGGFGHGLEPDLTIPESSAIATTFAMRILRRMGVGSKHPQVHAAMQYFVNTYQPAHNLWFIRPDSAGKAPCAPWWQHPWDLETLGLNPRAEILGYLYEMPEMVPPNLITLVDNGVLEQIGTLAEPVDMHSLLCMLRLARTPTIPDRLRIVVEQRLEQDISQTLARDPEKWQTYSLTPLQVAPQPDALFADQLADAVARNLDFVIETQGPDGAWAPTWSWGDSYPAEWAVAERAWKSKLTLDRLKALRDYGRFA